MKCLLIASESAEVLFHWTDPEYQQHIQEQYGASQEEGQGVRRSRRRPAVLPLSFFLTDFLPFFLLPFWSFQPSRTASAPCLHPSSSPAAPWWTGWVTATLPSPRRTTISTSYTRYRPPTLFQNKSFPQPRTDSQISSLHDLITQQIKRNASLLSSLFWSCVEIPFVFPALLNSALPAVTLLWPKCRGRSRSKASCLSCESC